MAVTVVARRIAMWLAFAVAGLAVFCGLYMAAAWGAAAFPARGKAMSEPPASPAAYLCEAPFHTDIALPLTGGGTEWREALAGYLPDWLGHDTYILFGWGDTTFFTDVLTPEDLTPGRAAAALLGLNEVSMRIVPVYGHDVDKVCRKLPGGEATRSALAAEILATLARDMDGRFIKIETPVEGELLLAAKGRYGPFNTCNQWTARTLGRAGLTHAVFAPFAWSVTKPLD